MKENWIKCQTETPKKSIWPSFAAESTLYTLRGLKNAIVAMTANRWTDVAAHFPYIYIKAVEEAGYLQVSSALQAVRPKRIIDFSISKVLEASSCSNTIDDPLSSASMNRSRNKLEPERLEVWRAISPEKANVYSLWYNHLLSSQFSCQQHINSFRTYRPLNFIFIRLFCSEETGKEWQEDSKRANCEARQIQSAIASPFEICETSRWNPENRLGQEQGEDFQIAFKFKEKW